MKLNAHTDFFYRCMIYVALHPERLVTAREIAEAYGLSLNHIAKVTQDLIKMKLLIGQRGRGGGVRLARTPEEIRLDELMATGESQASIVNCSGGIGGSCKILPVCRLKGIFTEAHEAFLAVLGSYTLADLISQPKMRKSLEEILLT